jgi:hypothetical protein
MDPRKRGCSTLFGWWFGTFSTFPYLGKNHPNSLSYFSEGLKSPTSMGFDGISWRCYGILWDLMGFSTNPKKRMFNIPQPTS